MSFSKLRKSRLTTMLVASAWLPYMLLCCCLVAPIEDFSSSQPDCHTLAGLLPTTAVAGAHSVHSEDHSARHQAAPHHGSSPNSRDGAPTRSCCELTGKNDVTIEQGVGFDAQHGLVTVAFLFSELTFPEPSVPSPTLVDLHEHSPPIYLTNASFLI